MTVIASNERPLFLQPRKRDLTAELGPPFPVCLDVAIRPCVKRDLPLLEWFGLFTEHREIFEEAFHRQQRGENIMLVAEANRTLIGQIWIDLTKRAREGAALLWALRVIPWLQRRGIGARLLRAAERVAFHQGFPCVELGVEKANACARRLYNRLGYSVVGDLRESYSYTRPDGHKVTIHQDEWRMRKSLADCRPPTGALPQPDNTERVDA